MIKCSEFVKRQTRTSDFSYFGGSWKTLEELACIHFKDHSRPGYRDGVVLINVPSTAGFFSAVVKIDESIEFETVFEARREGEEPFKKSVAYGIKAPAENVDIVLYHKNVLAEDPDHVPVEGAEWEIVSINCSLYDYDLPMTPQTMARNQLADDPEHGKGGTKAEYSGDEFAKSIIFWNTHTLIRERD